MKHLQSSGILHRTKRLQQLPAINTDLILCHQLSSSQCLVGMNSSIVANPEIHFLQSGAIKLDCLFPRSLIVMTYADAGQTEGKQSWSQGNIFQIQLLHDRDPVAKIETNGRGLKHLPLVGGKV